MISVGRVPGAWTRRLLAVPGVVATLLPSVTCPACWPAYAGLLSSLGVGFAMSSAFLLPLTIISLLVAVAALGLRAGERRGYAPLLLGLASSVVVLLGKFVFPSEATAYAGLVLLIVASLWNTWPRRAATSVTCPNCSAVGIGPKE